MSAATSPTWHLRPYDNWAERTPIKKYTKFDGYFMHHCEYSAVKCGAEWLSVIKVRSGDGSEFLRHESEIEGTDFNGRSVRKLLTFATAAEADQAGLDHLERVVGGYCKNHYYRG